MTETITSTDGVHVALHDLGGDGLPLLFVHATGFHGNCYRQIARRLHDVRHCWAPDLRGHGDTNVPNDDRFDWAGMAEDLCAVLDHMELDEPSDFVGHSMGGATILAAELMRPGSIRAAWLFEPIVFPDAPVAADSTLAAGARRRRAIFPDHEAAIERYRSRPPFDAIDPEVLDDYVRYGFGPHPDGVILKCLPDSEAATFENTDRTLYPRVHAIDATVTVIGSTDGGPPARFAAGVADAVPGARLVEWDGETHFGPFANPERAAAEIRSLIL